MALPDNKIEATKDMSTKVAYLDRTRLLFSQYTKQLKKNPKEDLPAFVDWLIAKKSKISSSTWNQYKSSIKYYLQEKSELELATYLGATSNKGCKEKKDKFYSLRKTSGQKKKSISEREERLIIEYIKQDTTEDSFWSKPVLIFFHATLATGLRPAEWQNAELITASNEEFEDKQLPVLKVRNAKHSNGRSHGEFRHLHVDQLGKSEILYIRAAIQYANPNNSDVGWKKPDGTKAATFDEYYKFIRSYVYRCTKKLFPTASRRVTLYSCRHQFIANLKKARYTREEIAALVGHATDETATEHYGRAKYGRSRSGLPKPNMNEVNRIKQVYQGKPSQEPPLKPNFQPS